MQFVPQSNHLKQRRRTPITVKAESRVKLFENRQARVVAKAFFEFVIACRAKPVADQFEEYFKNGQYDQILKLTDPQIATFCEVSSKVFIAGGTWQVDDIKGDFIPTKKMFIKEEVNPNVGVSFNPGSPGAVRAMQQQQLNMIREITESQRELIRSVLADALEKGWGPAEAARAFRQRIGLTTGQMGHVNSYRRALETGSRDALGRALRDRRFDRTIENAINRDIALSRQQIDRMVQRYQERMLAMRAETIARTEMMTALNAGRHEAMQQMVQDYGLEEQRIERTWRTTLDGRERDTHFAMNGQRRGAQEPFVSPTGAQLMYPGDMRAPGAERINCRCGMDIRIKEVGEIAADMGMALPVGAPPPVTSPTALDPSMLIRHPTANYSVPAGSPMAPRASGLGVDDFRDFNSVHRNDLFDIHEALTREGFEVALDSAEKAALSEYAGVNYNSINKALAKRLRTGSAGTEARDAVADAAIPHIDSAIKKAAVPEDIVLYRGLGRDAKFLDTFADLKAGEYVVFDTAYSSTSLFKDVAMDYARGGEKMVMKILVPKGSRALSMRGLGKYDNEFEYLLERGARFLVRSIEGNTVTVELV